MVIRKLLIIFMMLAVLGCAAAPKETKMKVKPEMSKAPVLQPLLPPPPPAFKETAMEFDPLADVYITLDAVEETLSSILYMIASESGLNLVISPDINIKKPFTITVNDMPVRDVLEIISESTGVYYEVSGNALKIVSSVTRTFKFPYVRMATTQNSQIGGDVFGSAEANLRGDYSLSYINSPADSNVQAQIINSIHAIMFPSDSGTDTSETVSGVENGTAAGSAANNGSGYFRGAEGYIYNRFTGVLKVTTTPSKMRMVESYMDDVLGELDKQVLIEAKLVEVILDDSTTYGVNWSGLASGTAGSLGVASISYNSGTYIGRIMNGSASGFLNLLASKLQIESIGNPSIRVMNGQSAMISSGTLEPFWEMDRETDADTNQTTVAYTRVTVLDGIMLGVTAHVKEDKTITLNIVPVFSKVEEVVQQKDENDVIVASYPKINLKEVGTVLNLESGSTIIIGGLIDKKETETESKVPGFGDIPLLGHLFKSTTTATVKRELVIFLTATIING